MIYHQHERACIADVMFCHGIQIMANSRICHCLLFHEHGKQNFIQPFRLSRKLIRYTHAWTKLHNKVMSWISGAYECIYAWPLPEANQVNATTVRDLTVSSVSSLPLSVIVRSRTFIGVELVNRTWICFSTCANLKSVRSFKYTHSSSNAVTLVWGSLRLAPINHPLSFHLSSSLFPLLYSLSFAHSSTSFLSSKQLSRNVQISPMLFPFFLPCIISRRERRGVEQEGKRDWLKREQRVGEGLADRRWGEEERKPREKGKMNGSR